MARTADLSEAVSATFSFDFYTTSGVDTSDRIAVEVSSDGGASYTLLETLEGYSGATNGTRSYDISGFASATTTIRFRVAELYGGSDEWFVVDNVQIEYMAGGGDVDRGSTETVLDAFNAISFSSIFGFAFRTSRGGS